MSKLKVRVQIPNANTRKIAIGRSSADPLSVLRSKLDISECDFFYYDSDNDEVDIESLSDLEEQVSKKAIIHVRLPQEEKESIDELSLALHDRKCVSQHSYDKNKPFYRCSRCINSNNLYCNQYEADFTHQGSDHYPNLINVSEELRKAEVAAERLDRAVGRYIAYKKNILYSKAAFAAQTVATTGAQGIKAGIQGTTVVVAETVAKETGRELVKAVGLGSVVGSTALISGIVGGACVAVETGLAFYKYSKGEITLADVGFRVGRSVVTNGITVGGSTTGALVGAGIGSLICPGVGTVVGGIIGSLIFGLCSAFAAKKASDEMEKWWARRTAELTESAMLRDALDMFDFPIEDPEGLISDPMRFNKKILNKKYHMRARSCHPDGGGSNEKFQALQAYHGFLLGVLKRGEGGDEADEVEMRRETVRAILALTC